MARAGAADPALCGRVYEQRLAADRRSRRAGGAYYTPPHLVDYTIDHALDGGTDLHVVDPACGGGAFLLAALARGVAPSHLHGVDIDPTAVAVCRLALALAGAPGADVRLGDALDDATEMPPADVVVGNPPWGQKGLRFPKARAAQLRRRYRTARGVLDPFALFVERGLELVGEGGRVALVLPDIVLLKNQRPVRDLLLEHRLELIAHAGRAFAGVNLDAVVLVARRGAAARGHRVHIDFGVPPERQSALPQSVFAELPGHRFNIHLTEPALAVLRRLAPLPPLGDRFEIHEGVHTGNARGKLIARESGPAREPIVIGRKELVRHRLAWGGAWIDLAPDRLDRAGGDYANLGRSEWHRAPKIVVRRTGDHVVAARDPDGIWITNNAFVVVPRAAMDAAAMAAHVALLNSRFMTWYFRTQVPRVGRLFAELKIEHLAAFPLPDCPPAALVERLGPPGLALERAAAAGRSDEDAERAVDDAVAALYRLDESTRQLIGGATTD